MELQDKKRISKLLGIELQDEGSLDEQGQPNIIDYVNHEPFLHSMEQRGVGERYPGTILLNNEPDARSPKPTDGFRPGGEFDKSSGVGSVGSTSTIPSIPTGHPLDPLDSEYSYREMKEALIKGDIKRLMQEAFVESEHDRDSDGRFAPMGGAYENLNLNKDRIKAMKENFKEHPGLYDDGKTFEDRYVTLSNGYSKMSDDNVNHFDTALDETNYDKSDELFLEAISTDKTMLMKFKEQAEELVAFNHELAARAKSTEEVHRFISTAELDHYLETGTIGKENSKSGFVSFSVEAHSDFFGEREVMVSMDANEIRDDITPVEYTNYPRDEKPRKEKRHSEKYQTYASEMEVRVNASTPVPKMKILIQGHYPVSEGEEMKEKYSKLGEVTFENRLVANEDWNFDN